MGENKLRSLDELTRLEDSIKKVADSGDVAQTICLCDGLKSIAKDNVKIAHIIRNEKYARISQRLQCLQKQSQYIPEEEVNRIYQEVDLLGQAEDIKFHDYLNFLQEDLPKFTQVIVERAVLKYRLRRNNPK